MNVDLVLPVTYGELLALLSSISTINCVYGASETLHNLEVRLRSLVNAASDQTAVLVDVKASGGRGDSI